MTVRVSELKGGVIVATDPIAQVETVSLGAWIGAGARHEPARLNGLAHLLEHMVFKGTRRRSAFDIASEIESVGGQINAYTGRENTAFYAKVLADDRGLALDIVSDILQNSVFDPVELAREREVVLQEIGQAWDTPDDIVFDLFQEAAYPDQACGRPVLGRAELVSKFERDQLCDYLGKNYGQKTLVITAAGKVDHDTFVGEVSAAFADLPQGQKPQTSPSRYVGGEARDARDLEQVHLVLGFPGPGLNDDRSYGLNLLALILGGGMSSRLFQEVREKRGLVYSVYSFIAGLCDQSLFSIYAGTGERQVEELVPLLCAELKRLQQDITAKELDMVKTQAKAAIIMSRESSTGRAESLAQQLLLYGRPIPQEELVAKIEAVSLGDLAELSCELLSAPPTLAAVGPLSHLESYEAIAAQIG